MNRKFEVESTIVDIIKVDDDFIFICEYNGCLTQLKLINPILQSIEVNEQEIQHYSLDGGMHNMLNNVHCITSIRSERAEVISDVSIIKEKTGNSNSKNTIQDLLNQVIQKQKENSER